VKQFTEEDPITAIASRGMYLENEIKVRYEIINITRGKSYSIR
jgi:hypothetical protein